MIVVRIVDGVKLPVATTDDVLPVHAEFVLQQLEDPAHGGGFADQVNFCAWRNGLQGAQSAFKRQACIALVGVARQPLRDKLRSALQRARFVCADDFDQQVHAGAGGQHGQYVFNGGQGAWLIYAERFD